MRLSIRQKTIAMILSFAIVLIAVSVFVYARVMWNNTQEFYSNKADETASLIAANIDVESVEGLRDEVMAIYAENDVTVSRNEEGEPDYDSPEYEAYLGKFTPIHDSENFNNIHEYLTKMEGKVDIDCAYLTYVDIPTESFIYLVDAAAEDACEPGTLDAVYEMNKPILSDPARGFPAYITNTDAYGWLVTAGATVKNASGEVVGYTMVDISMDEVRSAQFSQLITFILWLLLSVVLLCIIGILVINRAIVKPIKALSNTASDYSKNGSLGGYDGFSKLRIETGDEIESLAESMKRMEYDLNERINDFLAAKGEAKRSRHIANEMTEIANKDSLTGVRNKTAYDSEAAALDEAIEKGTAVFAIVMIDLNGLKKANDTYGHDRGDELIKSLSAMICDTFVHSPVFRIGGDEFVVIAKDKTYDELDSYIASLNEKIDQSSADTSVDPWLRVSAAVGYSAYDPERDKNVAEVFRHADEAMYERKREMKKNK